MAFIRNIRIFLLHILVFLTIYGYHPEYFNSFGESAGNGTSLYSFTVIAIILILSLTDLNKSFAYKPIFFYSIVLIVIGIVITTMIAFGIKNDFQEIRTLAIPFIALVIGASINLTNRQILHLCITFVITAIYVGYMQINVNIGGFEIMDVYYTNAKNSIGTILTIAGIMSILASLSDSSKRIFKPIMIICTLLIFVELLTIRARLASIIFILISGIVVYKYIKQAKYRYSNSFFSYALILLIVIVVVNFLSEYFIESLTLNREDDLTSGRSEVIKDSIKIFIDSPIWGNITLNREIGWVHNYLLLNLSSYGIIGAFPWILLYVYLFAYIMIGLSKTNISFPQNWGWFVIIISFATSLAEPTYPYGPGTTNFIPFLLLGVSIKNFK